LARLTNDPKGDDGELVARLLGAVFSPEDRDWIDLGIFLAHAVGGDELDRVMPDDGRDPVPGTMGAVMRKTAEVVSRDEYSRRVASRILSLVRSGVREDFLVRALRDELTATLQHMAQTEGGSLRRETDAASMQETANDPGAIASFRRSLAKRDPEAAKLNDEEIAKGLQEAAAYIGKPVSNEQEQEMWARSTRWNERAQAVSDRVIAIWHDRKMAHLLESARLPWEP